MQNRYGYFKRVNGVYYALDLQSQRQSSLNTRCEAEAKRLVAAKNQASDTPQLNRAMAKQLPGGNFISPVTLDGVPIGSGGELLAESVLGGDQFRGHDGHVRARMWKLSLWYSLHCWKGLCFGG